MTNYISVAKIKELINSISETEQNTYRSAIEEILKDEGVIIITDSNPVFDAIGNVTNTSQKHSTYQSKKKFLDWLDEILGSYWVPIKNENEVYVEGPFNIEEANKKRQNIINNNDKIGSIFNAKDKELATKLASSFF